VVDHDFSDKPISHSTEVLGSMMEIMMMIIPIYSKMMIIPIYIYIYDDDDDDDDIYIMMMMMMMMKYDDDI